MLTLLEKKKKNSVIAVAKDLTVSRETIYQLKWSAASLLPGIVPERIKDPGATKKISSNTNNVLGREVMLNSSMTSFELKNKHSELLKSVSTRTIHLQL